MLGATLLYALCRWLSLQALDTWQLVQCMMHVVAAAFHGVVQFTQICAWFQRCFFGFCLCLGGFSQSPTGGALTSPLPSSMQATQ